jgi:serine/threonine protein kinase
VQYGIGLDESLEDAFSLYELMRQSDRGTIHLQHSFRCLRSANKATLKVFPSQVARSCDWTNQSLDYCNSIRPLTRLRCVSAFLVESSDSLHAEVIGQGGSSHVKLFGDSRTGNQVAVKYIDVPRSISEKAHFMREVEVLVLLNHPCIVQLVGWRCPEGSNFAEIHTEYAERGSLRKVVNRRQSKSESEFWSPTRIGIVICDIVLGMRFVHSRAIIHRDLKPSNILIRANGRALIGDFGSSCSVDSDATITGLSESGTVHYAAPELFEDDAEPTAKVDVFAFGLILYEIITGHPVRPLSMSPFDVIRQIRSGYQPTFPRTCGEYMKATINRCLSRDPSSRPSFDELLRGFGTCKFKILPGVDCDEIAGHVQGVRLWESKAYPDLQIDI